MLESRALHKPQAGRKFWIESLGIFESAGKPANGGGQLLAHHGPYKGPLQGEVIVRTSVKIAWKLPCLLLICAVAQSDSYHEGLLKCQVKP